LDLSFLLDTEGLQPTI